MKYCPGRQKAARGLFFLLPICAAIHFPFPNAADFTAIRRFDFRDEFSGKLKRDFRHAGIFTG
jgi:hypothetical protein